MNVVRSSPLRAGHLYPIYSFLEAEPTPGHMVPSVASEKKSPSTPLWIDPETLPLVAQCLNHYATQAPTLIIIIIIIIIIIHFVIGHSAAQSALKYAS
jgi:hypothetical protein